MSISPNKAKALLKRITGLRILVVGDVMLDHYIWGDATRISPEAPVPVIDIARDTWTAGGAANVAINIAASAPSARSSASSEATSRRAPAGHPPREGRRGREPRRHGTTIVKTRVMVQHQQLCRLDRESPPASYAVDPPTPKSLLGRAIRACDAVVFSDYAKGLLSDGLVAAVTKLARAERKFIALDPKPKNPLAFRGLDLITPNKREALQLAGIEPGPGGPVPRRGRLRAAPRPVCDKERRHHARRGRDAAQHRGRVVKTIPTAAREVYDVSGAGDTALAGLVLALTSGAGLEEAAHFANAAAGVVVGKLGTATVTPKELLDHLSAPP
jgi:D-glycero-beta-D-manno-heptose-7-phosphate kinase